MTNTNDTVIVISGGGVGGASPDIVPVYGLTTNKITGGAGGSGATYSQWRREPVERVSTIYTNITIVGGRGGDYIDNGVGVGVFDVIHFFITLVTLILVLRLSIKSDEEEAPEEEEETDET